MATKRYRTGGGVVIDNGKMLLLDRPTRNEVRLPKGHIETGEDAQSAALRETCEESGYVDLRVVADLGVEVVEFDYKGDHYVRHEHYFLMALNSAQQLARSEEDAQQFVPIWTPLDEVVARLTFAAEKLVAQKALDYQQKKAG